MLRPGTEFASLLLAWSPLLLRRLRVFRRVLCLSFLAPSWILFVSRNPSFAASFGRVSKGSSIPTALGAPPSDTVVTPPPPPLLVLNGCVRFRTPLPSPRPSRGRGLWAHWPLAFVPLVLFVREFPLHLPPPIARRVFGARSDFILRNRRTVCQGAAKTAQNSI